MEEKSRGVAEERLESAEMGELASQPAREINKSLPASLPPSPAASASACGVGGADFRSSQRKTGSSKLGGWGVAGP